MTDFFASLIYRPPRMEYCIEDLGPDRFMIGDQFFMRKDFQLQNRRDMAISCSYYYKASKKTGRPESSRPCVVYLHGNSGSRLDADDYVEMYLDRGMNFFSVDLGGCGLSEGDYVTLGCREREDVEVVLDFLKTQESVSYVALYGRSMGAATALLVASDDRYYHCVSGLVLDSCYTSIRSVIQELAQKYVGKVPLIPVESMTDTAVDALLEVVEEKTGFNIDEVDIAQAAKYCQAPVLLGHAADDELVDPFHSKRLYDEYGGKKHIFFFDGDHNSIRPTAFTYRALEFLDSCFKQEAHEASCQRIGSWWRNSGDWKLSQTCIKSLEGDAEAEREDLWGLVLSSCSDTRHALLVSILGLMMCTLIFFGLGPLLDSSLTYTYL